MMDVLKRDVRFLFKAACAVSVFGASVTAVSQMPGIGDVSKAIPNDPTVTWILAACLLIMAFLFYLVLKALINGFKDGQNEMVVEMRAVRDEVVELKEAFLRANVQK